jgi:hypothetical protein
MKNFTLVEFLVALVFTLAVMTLVYSVVVAVAAYKSGDSDYADYSFINPQVETARSQRRMAEEMQRQNDLLQRRLELLEQQNNEKQH